MIGSEYEHEYGGRCIISFRIDRGVGRIFHHFYC